MPIQTLKLPVSDGHTLHVELAGNPDGLPVLFLHGGPGAGINGNYQWPFDLTQYRIIAFDQRGCGHSQPFGSLLNNSTQDLVDDIEAIRAHFNIDRWMIFGGSWGATLALCYAIAHPEHVQALILRGIFLARQEDFDWFLRSDGGAAQVFPDAYEKFIGALEKDLRTKSARNDSSEITECFYKRFSSSNEQIANRALNAWFNWEGAISKIIPDPAPSSDIATNQQVKSLALLENHYLRHRCFIEEGYILKNASQLAKIETYIVHGRYDMVCKVSAAHSLHSALRQSHLFIIDDAGHSASEPKIKAKLIEIMKDLAYR